MIRVALRGLAGRKLRSALTAVAIVLGVGMVTGTYVLTDAISSAFNTIFEESYHGTDAVVTKKTLFTGQNGGFEIPSFSQSVLDDVKAVPDVQDAIAGVGGEAQIIRRNGKALVFGGAPNLGFSVDPSRPEFNTLTLVDGKWPGAGEVVIDRKSADEESFKVGEKIQLQGAGPVLTLRLSGIVRFGKVASIGGATLAGFDLATAQKVFNKQGSLDQIRVAAKAGVSPTKLVGELRDALPNDLQIRTGEQQASSDAKDTNEFISILQKFLLAFGGIALFVGSFVIANSLSITIAQRTREFATLRTLGASRKQVMGSIVVEALVLGILAAISGILFGLLLAKGLSAMFDAIGFTLPKNELTLETRTIVVSLIVGIGVTLLASLRPAFRATRVPPIAAVREGFSLPRTRLARLRPIAVSMTVIVGFAAILYALFRDNLGTTQVLLWLGVGALLLFIGIALISAYAIRPFTRVVHPIATWAVVTLSILVFPITLLFWAVLRPFGPREFPNPLPDRRMNALAAHNAQRNTQRTASTAAALMVGLALVTLVATLASGIISTFRGAVDDIFTSNYVVTAQNNFSPIPIAAAEAAGKAHGVTTIASVRSGDGRVFGSNEFVTGIEPDLDKVMTLKWAKGSPEAWDLGLDGAVVSNTYADQHHLKLGSPITVVTSTGGRLNLKIKGIFDPPAGGSPLGTVTFSSELFDKTFQNPKNIFTFVQMSGGQTDANSKALEDSLKEFPNAKSQTRDEFVDNQIKFLQQSLNVLYVLLALSVIVSLFGIINTLVLTVFERTRELGMLRAIGMTRRQTRRMIRHESVLTALIGGALGIAVGLVLAALLVARIDFIDFSPPVGQIIVFTIAAVIVGIVAAIFPARRAAKLNILEALQYE